ncbi:hypothetical protein GCM10007897_25670 [Sphingobium jiangsuense]|uniref:Transcriptional regulator of met regulon n=1 Tax=Sphingobium jiangsuense TaxID=870476 RepID=A0A7W6BLT0_9SPHN|nr:hypothetical protein [Sphingobium jiangsuense]MBB3927452.1 transcriptional regulator of met regulon [Sphingobium jiangsuense]GLT01176.1 hypothetical protein GCM10007897_25670 [Sphingobium jiangsuense]
MAKTAQIKNLTVDLPLKNNGVEIQIDGDGKQFGDIYISKTGIVWCEGKVHRTNGVKFSFDELNLLAQYKDEVIKAAKKAKKDAEI